jgi:hypothetical protein
VKTCLRVSRKEKTEKRRQEAKNLIVGAILELKPTVWTWSLVMFPGNLE